MVKNGATVKYTYVYEDGLLRQMSRGSRVYDFIYDAYGNPVSIAYRSRATANPLYYYYGTNSRGDVVSLYDSNGLVVALYEYDAYGKLLSIKNPIGGTITGDTNIAIVNPLRYRGYVYDTETGFYYLQSRYYDPTTCRFINADGYCATGQGITGNNMFAYCNNNPVMYADPAGNCSKHVGYYMPSCPDCNPDLGALIAERGAHWAVVNTEILNYNPGPYGVPNSHTVDNADGYIRERWYGPDGRAVKDKHHTDHGNSKLHHNPHIQYWKWDDPKNPKLLSNSTASEVTSINWAVVGGIGLIGVGLVLTVYFVGNDVTGAGVIDDVAIAPAIGLITKGVQMVTT